MTTVYEYPEARRLVITASGSEMSRDEATARGFKIAPYKDLVAQSARIATPRDGLYKSVSLPPFGISVGEGTAKAMGFSIAEAPDPSASRQMASKPISTSTWRAAIFASPEARDRPSAVAEIVTSQSPDTMTADAARAFLRGLPLETQEQKEPMTTDVADLKAARRAEIGRSMHAFNKNNGYASAKADAATQAPIDPAKAERLAQIEQSAASFNRDRGYRSSSKAQPALKQLAQARLSEIRPDCAEAKNLRYALETHEQTGAPLSRCLAQLGVDTSSFVRS